MHSYCIFFFFISASLKQCYCLLCQGSWVNRKTFFNHSNTTINNVRQSVIPEKLFDENEYLSKKYQKPLYAGSDISLMNAIFEHMYIFPLTMECPNLLCHKLWDMKRITSNSQIYYNNHVDSEETYKTIDDVFRNIRYMHKWLYNIQGGTLEFWIMSWKQWAETKQNLPQKTFAYMNS